MIDTSVIIDVLRGNRTEVTAKMSGVRAMQVPVGLSAYTYMEVLCGTKGELEFQRIRKYLEAYKIYFLPETIERYRGIAKMYSELRRNGITPRGEIDLMIAATAIKYDLYLLHDDRDFDQMATVFPKLKIWRGAMPSQ